VRRVVVLDASEEHAARLNEGLRLDELGEERTVKIEAVTEPPDEAFDFILVTLKAAHHEAVKPLKGTFVSLVQDRLEALVGEGNLISGIVEWGHEPRPRPPRADDGRPVRGGPALRPHAAAGRGARTRRRGAGGRGHRLGHLGKAARQPTR
jgi:hypothetical protein